MGEIVDGVTGGGMVRDGETCSPPRRLVVLTNYARPWNIPQQIAYCQALSPTPELVLIDNSDGPSGSNLPAMDLSGVTVLRSGRNLGPTYRFSFAASRTDDVVLCLDDDILLSTAQIETILRRQAREPDRVHGVWGEDIQRCFNRITFKTNLWGRNREVDILNRLYVFTPAQARHAQALARALGFESLQDVGPCEDIILSFAGARKPACHDLGAIENCSTSDDPEIACWRRQGFYSHRRNIVQRLMSLRDVGAVAPSMLYRCPSFLLPRWGV